MPGLGDFERMKLAGMLHIPIVVVHPELRFPSAWIRIYIPNFDDFVGHRHGLICLQMQWNKIGRLTVITGSIRAQG